MAPVFHHVLTPLGWLTAGVQTSEVQYFDIYMETHASVASTIRISGICFFKTFAQGLPAGPLWLRILLPIQGTQVPSLVW